MTVRRRTPVVTLAGALLASVGVTVPAAGPASAQSPSTGFTAAAVAAPDGYWLLGQDGRVWAFGRAAYHGDLETSTGARVADAVDLEPTPDGRGYWVLSADCRIRAFGPTPVASTQVTVAPGDRCVSLSATPDGRGLWVFTPRGDVRALGSARTFGDLTSVPLNGPVLDSVSTPSGGGYYMVASDGGVFAFGDARFAGSMGGRRLNAPVESLVPDPDGAGYWLVAGDGGVFAFDAPFRGSVPGVLPPGARLNAPVAGMVAYGNGYVMVGEDGGVFAFTDRPFLGSLGSLPPATPIVAVAPAAAAASSAVPGVPVGLAVDVAVGGLSNPWDIAFLPDGTMLFTERPGRVRALDAAGTLRTVGAPADVTPVGEAGMLGLAVDPAFAANRFVYTCFTTADGTRLVRWRLSGDGSALTDRRDLVTGLPRISSGRHSGCIPRFGPDGFLWLGTGDAAIGTTPQDLRSLGGKVLRIDRDGNPAPGNPSLGPGADPRIYTYGHRNVQGLAFRPGTGQPYAAEHGSSVDDEVNRLRAGGNSGWNPVPGYNESVPMTDLARYPDAMVPVFRNADSQGLSGIGFVTGPAWRGWDGALMAGFLSGQRLQVLRLDAAGDVVSSTPQLTGRGQRLRQPVQGPDGALYLTVDAGGGAGQILRIRPR